MHCVTTAGFSRKPSRTLYGPCDTILDRNCVMQVVFRFCKVHETSRTLKVTCGVGQGQEEVRRSDIVTTAFNTASAARKTVDNTLGNMVNNKQLRRPKKGIYALNPKDIQKLNLVPDHTLGTTIGKSVNSSYTNQIDLVSSHDIETPL